MSWTEYLSFLSTGLAAWGAAGVGFFLRRADWLTESAMQSLLRVTVNVFLPALVVNTVLENVALKQIATLALAPGIGLMAAGTGLGAALLLARHAGRFFGLSAPGSAGAFAVCAGIGFFNFFPLALAQMQFGRDIAGVMLAHNFFLDAVLLTAGPVLLGVSGAWRGWRKMVSAPLAAVAAAAAINGFGWEAHVPRFALWTAGLLGPCAIPMGLVLSGAALAECQREFRPAATWRPMLASLLLRPILMGGLYLLLVRFLPCAPELKQVLMLQGIIPAAVFPALPMVRHYGGNVNVAVGTVAATSIAGLLILPFWFQWGIFLAGTR